MQNEKYFKEVLKRFDKEVKAIKASTTPADISVRERQLSIILNELQMALPRLGDDVYQLARDRRKDILEGK